MRAITTMLALAVSLMMVGNLAAAEEKKGPEGRHPRGLAMERGDVLPAAMLKGLNLTDDQKAKFEELKKEYGPKFKDAWQNTDSVLTADQKKAREEAVKAAKAAGKKGGEVWKDVQAAMKLTDEQKAKMAELRTQAGALHKEFREKIAAILTPEQKEQLEKQREGARQHPPMGEKKREGAPDRGPMGWRDAMLKGLDLTDDQKAKVKELMKEYGPKLKEARQGVETVRKEMHEKVLALLTPEQKEQLKNKRELGREHKAEGK